MHKILLIPFLSLALAVTAQNSKKGFKFLEKAEYEKSAEVFKEVLKEKSDDPAASFGLAMIFGDEKSPLFNLVDSWDFALKCKSNEEKLTPEELEFIGEYFQNTETRVRSMPVKKKINYAIETVEDKLIKYVREENNLELVYEVLDKFPDYKYHDNVMHIRNQFEFRKYEKQNTLEGYLEFIQKFPDAAQIDKAKLYRNRLAYDKAVQTNTVEAYKEYMKNYPDARECNQAVKMLNAAAFQQAKKENTVPGFDDFILQYPDALEVADAKILQKGLLYDYAKKIHTMEAYNDFITKYPDGQQYIDIFNLRSLDKGMKLMETRSFPSDNLQWARSFGSEETKEFTACMAIDSLNNSIAGGTIVRSDTGRSDAWVIKTGPDGKMIWNKTVGEENNDELSILENGRHNEILGVGHTWLGLDSSSRETWIFKMGADGQKLWSKKLGRLKVNCLLTAGTGNIYLAGSESTDTSTGKYAIVALNENGKHLWNRSYTGDGELVKLCPLPNNYILMAGNHWRAKIDARGYLVSESSFAATDSILHAITLPKGEILYIGIRNKIKTVFIKTSWDNKPIYDKEAFPQDSLFSVRSIIPGVEGQVITLMDFARHQSVSWLNIATGAVAKTVLLPSGMTVTGIRKDYEGNLILVALDGEIILIKNTGVDL
jgi:hypothetical protein